jgi:gliding motility-associated-like protein
VFNDKEVNLVFEQAEVDSFWRYRILKRTGRSGAFEMQTEIRNHTDTLYTDKNVDVDKHSYCYQLVNVDLCGNTSVENKIACTILLQGNAIPFENNMSWQPYDYWSQGINRYEVLKTEPSLYQDNLFATRGDKPLMAVDNKLNYDNGLYKYTILAYENLFGNGQTSKSNTIDLIQLPLLYAPNAYTENGDGLNDVYHLVPVFVKDYHLQIYNRWGERIFETYDKKEGFNSLYKGESVKGDVYFYIVNYTGWDESKYIKKGNFTLLK